VNDRHKIPGSKPDRRPLGRPAQRYFGVVLAGLLLTLSQAGGAADGSKDDGADATSSIAGWFDSLYLQAGVGRHWTDDEDYTTTPLLVGLEGRHDDRHLVGVSLFENSFGQFSQYFYYGYKWRIPAISESVHVKLSGGLIHGYTGEYEDKLEFNHNGWAPVIIPSVGWKRDKLGFDFSILGTSGFMLLVGYDIWER
jgi:hypothetical protein